MLSHHNARIILWIWSVNGQRACLAGKIIIAVCRGMKVVEIGVGGDVRLLLLLFILELLVVLLLAILFLLHFLAPLMHVEVLVFIVIIRNGALSSMRIKSENFSAHLEGKPAMERSDYEVFPDEHQSTKLGFVVFEEKAAILKVVDKVGVMSGN